ncbi:hypothetical protein SADUNF_Sadunf03G0131700 [Salix dunnii]|uniref:Uncharacterized protein n=1 Tax=Salix dunnii TaxID=1413687 RepID=A0A835N4N4_9ROSI|nr:hypothetical protein SADUNF_Sadunf03G0131700 [Salix dunnii]
MTISSYGMSLTVVTMATSRHLAVIKVNRFKRIITKRGACLKAKKKGKDYPVGPVLLGFFISIQDNQDSHNQRYWLKRSLIFWEISAMDGWLFRFPFLIACRIGEEYFILDQCLPFCFGLTSLSLGPPAVEPLQSGWTDFDRGIGHGLDFPHPAIAFWSSSPVLLLRDDIIFRDVAEIFGFSLLDIND